MFLQYLGLVLVVAHSALSSRVYQGRHYQFSAISNKLDTYISRLETVGGELKDLNAAYKNLKQQDEEYISDNSYDEGRVMPLLGSANDRDTWDDNTDRCKWAEFEISRDYYQDQLSWTKKVFCDELNHFLTAIEYSDQRGVLVGKCCEKKGKKKKNKG